MWDVPSYRIRAYLRATKNPTAARKRTRSVLHCKRVEAEIRIHDGFGTPSIIIPARVILNDLTATSIKVFCDRPLFPGQMVSITLKAPRAVYLRGEVRYSQNINPSLRVISNTPYHYRLGIVFTFTNLTEQEAISEYSSRVHTEDLNSIRTLKDV